MLIIRRLIWALCCWLFGTGIGFTLSIGLAGWPDGGSYGIPPIVILPAILLYGLPVWLFAFLPSYFIIKDRSIFWNPILASIFGATAGFLGLLILLGGNSNDLIKEPTDERALAWMPLFIGAFTFFLGSLAKQNYLTPMFDFQISDNASTNEIKSPEDY